MAPLHEHQGLRKKFEELTIIEDETFAQYKAEKKKVERLKGKFQKAREQMETICSLYSDTLSCQAPTRNYALFLMEIFLLLKVKAAKAGKPVEIKATPDFIKFFREHDEKVQCLLCELYMHNFFLEDDRDRHPGPFIGDIQFHTFLSFATNQLKWAKVHNTFIKCEYGIDLWIIGEPTQPLLLSVRHK